MKVLVIGGTGHIGKFLVPQLCRQGCQVTVISRGQTAAGQDPEWRNVELVSASYTRHDETWCKLVADLRAEVIIDILGSDVPGTYAAGQGACRHYIACGSVWMFGQARVVPTPPQTQGPCEFEWYAKRYEELQATMKSAEADGIPFTAVMPPNICGPGKAPIEAAGGRDLAVHKSQSKGQPVTLPHGCNTLVGPCDASDVAQGFALAAANRDKAAGQMFNVGASYALTFPQLVETYARIYATDIPIQYVGWDQFLSEAVPAPDANYHFRHHMAPDISKTAAALGYAPQFTPAQTMTRAVEWMRDQKLL